MLDPDVARFVGHVVRDLTISGLDTRRMARAGVAELVDARGLGPRGRKPWGFESLRPHASCASHAPDYPASRRHHHGRAKRTRSSTPPTRACWAAEGSTGRSTAPPGRSCWRSAARSAAATPATRRSPAPAGSRSATSSTPSARSGTAASSGEPELLASCYRRAIELAAEHGDARVAFPAISTGVYGYPLEAGARVAIDATRAAMEQHPEVDRGALLAVRRRRLRAFETAAQRFGPMNSSSAATLWRCETEMLRWLDCVQRIPSLSQYSQNSPRMSADRFEKK